MRLAPLALLALTVPATVRAAQTPADPPPRLAERPGPHLATAPLPLAGPDVLPTFASRPHLLYINFDGAVLRRGWINLDLLWSAALVLVGLWLLF